MDPVTVATSDDELLEAALRWCAAAGVDSDVVDDVTRLRSRWRSAPLVLVGDDLAERAAAAALVRRDGVLLVSRDPDTTWRSAIGLGAAGVLRVDDDQAAVAVLGRTLDGDTEGCAVAVVSGSGGVGATTFAAALAVEASRRGHGAVAIDGDPRSSGLELVLGAEHATGLRWPDLGSAIGQVAADSLADALPRHRGVALVSWPSGADDVAMPPTADDVWSAATRGFDLVVADLPGVDDPWAASVAAGSVLTVMVVADDVLGVAAARRRIGALRATGATIVVVLVGRPAGLGAPVVEQTLGVPVVTRLRTDRRLRIALDHGAGPRGRSLRRATGAVLDLVGLTR